MDGEDPNKLMEAAANWAARRHSDRWSVADERELQAWIAEDPGRDEVYAKALRTLALMEVAAQRSLPQRRARVLLRHVATAAMVALAVLGGAYWTGDPWMRLMADHATAHGETRRITLPDGGAVTLGARTVLAVDYDGASRRVRLLAGVALFELQAPGGDDVRPFVVEAGTVSVAPLGTVFTVDRLGERVDVVVVEDEVRVSRRADAREAALAVLGPRKGIIFDAGRVEHVRPVTAARATAWTRGQLIFDERRLGDVVTILNRYRRGRIVILDPDLADRDVSGAFTVSDVERAADTIAQSLDLTIARIGPFATLLY